MFNLEALNFVNEVEKECEPIFAKLEDICLHNQKKMLNAFRDANVNLSDIASSTGYGNDDRARVKLSEVYANAFGVETGIVSPLITSGTHALTIALFGVLRPDDVMFSVTGKPYDTLIDVIFGEGIGSLKDFKIKYEDVELGDNDFDYDTIKEKVIKIKPKMIYIQRSRGYTSRESLSVSKIEKLIKFVKLIDPNVIVMVDNCYGEFTEKLEPTQVGADLIAGSLIKNAGGGIAPSGGYIAGRKDLVELCGYRLTTPGLGTELGATLGQNRSIFMGLFNSPHVVGEALKTAIFAASLFTELGVKVTPEVTETRHDIIQAICLENSENLIAFCQGLQKGAPVDSYVTPEPWDMPGYDSQVIMSAGAFTSGSSIELSADAPLREPYAVWMQGGLNFNSSKVGIMLAAKEVMKLNNM